MQVKNNSLLSYKPFGTALLTLAVTSGLFIIFGANGWGIPAENEQAIGQISRWCERVSGGFFREPANTLGNLGFVFTGLYMFYKLAQDATSGKGIKNVTRQDSSQVTQDRRAMAVSKGNINENNNKTYDTSFVKSKLNRARSLGAVAPAKKGAKRD